MANQPNLWSDIVEKTQNFAPFYSWIESEACSLKLTQSIEEYEIQQIKGQYGIGNYIQILAYIQNSDIAEYVEVMLKVDSKRLRKALVNICAKITKYPVVVDLKREGSELNTTYSAELVKIPVPKKTK